LDTGSAPQRRISSRGTRFWKYGFPLLWFGFLTCFFVVLLVAALTVKVNPPAAPFLLFPFVMAGVGYFVFRYLAFSLADVVIDAGDALIVRKGRVEDRIPLSNIMNVSYQILTNPPRVTLSLRKEGALGSEVTFLAPATLWQFSRSPVIMDLIRRIDEARNRAQPWGLGT